MNPVRVLIVDDEPPARAKLRRLLAAEPGVEVAGEAGSGPEAVTAILDLRPDLVFLDVRMPGFDGFSVLAEIEDEGLPVIVFVTAFDDYAVRAFDVNAVDYLLKPYDAERFRTALDRARRHVGRPEDSDLERRLRSVLAELSPRPEYLERLLVTMRDRSLMLEVSDIDWIEAEQNYVRLHVGGQSHLVRGTLARLEQRLDPQRFMRIHRSHIVNASRIRELHPWSHGDFRVVLTDGTTLTMSRRYRDRLPDSAV